MTSPDSVEGQPTSTRVNDLGNARCIAFGLGLLALAVQSWVVQPWTMDDAYIYMRYAENFALGNGVVYNPGVRVEGYTTFLWVSLLAGARVLGIDLVVASKVYGFVFATLSLYLVATAYRWFDGLSPRACAGASVLLGASGVFGIWAMAGMDAPMVAFFSLLVLLQHLSAMASPNDRRSTLLGGGLAGLAMIARPECSIAIAVVALHRLTSDIRARRWTTPLYALTAIAVYAPFFAWRYSYYGYLLPNTFYVKVGGSTAQLMRGFEYAGDFAWASIALLIPALLGLLAAVYRSRTGGAGTRERGAATPAAWVAACLLLSLAALQTLYVIMVGGDAMPAYRFFAIAMPTFALLAGWGLDQFARQPAHWGGALVALLGLGVFQTINADSMLPRVRSAQVGDYGREVGLWMRDRLPPDTVIAVNAAGATAYYSGFRTIDMLGLNDAHISHRQMPDMGEGIAGHEKGDGAYVLAAEPDYIQFGPSWGQRMPMFVGDREIRFSAAFRRDYVFEEYTLPSGRTVKLYRRSGSPKPRAD